MIFKPLPVALLLLLGAALAGVFYWQVKPLLQHQQVVQHQVVQADPPETTATSTRKAPSEHTVEWFMLLENVLQDRQIVKSIQENLPETKLRLTLTGIVSSEEDHTGVFIEGPDKETRYYQIGDELPGNATIKQIFPDRVVVQRADQLENLYFPGTASAGIEPYIDEEGINEQPAIASIPQNAPKTSVESMDNARREKTKELLSNGLPQHSKAAAALGDKPYQPKIVKMKNRNRGAE